VTYRDDHAAAIARIDALEHDNAGLARDNLLLEVQLARAREWLGGPRKRLALLLGGVAAAAAIAVGGYALGRSTTPDAVVVAAVPPAPALPATSGTMLGWDHLTGPWTMRATRCAVHRDGVELTAAGSDGHSLWLGPSGLELESPSASIPLDEHHCFSKLQHDLVRHDDTTPPTYSGYVSLECRYDGDVVVALIEFHSCR
jgi:hypothetical protein